MIIKKTSNKNSDTKSEKGAKVKSSIIKASAKKVQNSQKAVVEEKKPKDKASENQIKKPEPPKKSPYEAKIDEYKKIDVTAAEFKERFERRRGERRRGFRRIDERALVSRAQEEAFHIREAAAQEGYKKGLELAEAETAQIASALKEFVAYKNEVHEDVSSHILEIALEVAKKIIKKEVELSNDVLKSVLTEVISELDSQEEKITVKVNSEDVDFTKASLPEILKEGQIDAKIIVTGDDSIEKGSCCVIASNGVIDANFSTQLAIIQNAFGIYKGGD